MTQALASVLLGTVAWVMCLFYYINSEDKDIRNTTWHTLSEMVSIFMAVLLFNAVRQVTNLGHEMDHHAPPTYEVRLIGLVRMLLFFVVLKIGLYIFRFRNRKIAESQSMPKSREMSPTPKEDSERRNQMNVLRVVGTLGAHFLGFSMIEVFGSVLVVHFNRHVLLSLFGFFVCLAIVSIMHATTSFIRTVVKAPGKQEEELEWREICAETENESAAISMGLVLSLFVRFAIVGEMPPVHGTAKNHSATEVWKLFGCALGFGGLLAITAIAGSKIKGNNEPADDNWRDCFVHRMVDFAERLMTMSMGWCLLHWGKWFYWEITSDRGLAKGSVVGAELVQVALFSLIAFISIRFIDRLADRLTRGTPPEIALRRTITMFGLLMGLSWESTFNTAVEALGDGYEGATRVIFDAIITFGICLAVGPAWAMYILPHSTHAALEREATLNNGQGEDDDKAPLYSGSRQL